jgi:DNA-binding PadR family transcriptional regulator
MARKPNTSPQTLRLLDVLLDRPEAWRYGYDLSRETGLKSGTLYPQLVRLEASGWLEAKWEDASEPGRPARHMYRLTASGLQHAPALVEGRVGLDARDLRPAVGETS